MLSCEVGGRWNADAVKLVQRLVALRAHLGPPLVESALRSGSASRRSHSRDLHMPMRRPWMRSYTWPTQMGRPTAWACRARTALFAVGPLSCQDLPGFSLDLLLVPSFLFPWTRRRSASCCSAAFAFLCRL